jgi:hypothetical protein
MKKWLEYVVSELFSNRKCRGLGPWLGAWPHCHSRAWELTSGGTTERRGHRDPGSGLTGARAVVESWRDRGNERRGLELGASATEGARELKREGKRGGEGRGCSSPFIGPGGRRR